MKQALICAAAVLAVSTAVPAQAVPSVDKVGIATASVTFVGSDRATYPIDILARLSEAGVSQGSGRIEVTIRRCVSPVCTKGVKFAAKLSASDLSVSTDLSTGRLSARAFGLPLVLTLTATDDTTSVDGKFELYQPVLPTGQVRVWVKQERQANTRVQLLGRSCAAVASTLARDEIVDGVVLQLQPTLPSSLPATLAALRNARCA